MGLISRIGLIGRIRLIRLISPIPTYPSYKTYQTYPSYKTYQSYQTYPTYKTYYRVGVAVGEAGLITFKVLVAVPIFPAWSVAVYIIVCEPVIEVSMTS